MREALEAVVAAERERRAAIEAFMAAIKTAPDAQVEFVLAKWMTCACVMRDTHLVTLCEVGRNALAEND